MNFIHSFKSSFNWLYMYWFVSDCFFLLTNQSLKFNSLQWCYLLFFSYIFTCNEPDRFLVIALNPISWNWFRFVRLIVPVAALLKFRVCRYMIFWFLLTSNWYNLSCTTRVPVHTRFKFIHAIVLFIFLFFFSWKLKKKTVVIRSDDNNLLDTLRSTPKWQDQKHHRLWPYH